MKKYFVMMFCMLGSYLSSDNINESDLNSCQVSSDLLNVPNVDLKHQIKVALSMFLSSDDGFGSFIDAITISKTADYYLNLEQKERQESVQRYYTFIAALEILRNKDTDIEQGVVENFKIELEEKFHVNISKYNCLSLNNKNRADVAYCLCLANAATFFTPETLVNEAMPLLEKLNLTTIYDQHMLINLLKTYMFLSLSEAELLFHQIPKNQRRLVTYSTKLVNGVYTTTTVANKLNQLFLE